MADRRAGSGIPSVASRNSSRVIRNSYLDLWVLAIFGVLGYALRKLQVDASPLVVALVLGPMMEKTLRQALFLTRGSVVDLVARSLTAAILVVTLAVFIVPARPVDHGRVSRSDAGERGAPVVLVDDVLLRLKAPTRQSMSTSVASTCCGSRTSDTP